MDGNLVIFLVIGAFYIVSAVVQYMAKQASENRQNNPGANGDGNASNNFIEEMQRRAQEQQRNQDQSRDAPVILKPVQRREVGARPLKARVVARPQAKQSPDVRRVSPEPARSRHIHSKLEDERDLSDVDERHLAHLSSNLRSGNDLPETELRVAPRGGRSLGNQVAINYDVDESIDINSIGRELSPIQRAFVFSEIFAKRPAFDDGDETIRSF
ncbi:MAG: hypothetical protein P1V97_37270 [Planctomycetota bacterium]|nr:hypothetical protein [Planctomycetota bacterium]